ncbi:hypothetical protein KUTeg_000731 [Tegillarca granosa]|uniref:G-protein coupled receptors family 1 profile domain-containing protein n=1 Tax=Tegillarca granosa TaxID=220873 RepID=A0ABQ9G2P3_TEGGR|nr:hypothetical protein KUTeg_000731 [Tegillarca granosa]
MAANISLDQINQEVVETIVPVIVYVVILMVIGIVGNPLVIVFYGIKLKATASYMFIVSLAVFDLIVSCISMPLEIVDLVQFYTFESEAACKILRFVNYFATITSGVFLIAIAVDRYRKICRPFKPQITNEYAKIVIIISMIIGFFLSWPSFVFYTVQEINITETTGVIGRDCTTNRDEGFRLYITAYNILLFLCFFVSIVALLVLYCLVGRQLFNLRSFRFYVSKDKQPKEINRIALKERNGIETNVSKTTDSTHVYNKPVDDIDLKDEEVEEQGEKRDGALSTIQEHDDDEDFGSVSRPGSAVQQRPLSSKSLSLPARTNPKMLPVIATRVAPDKFNLDREYTGLTGITESSGRTYRTGTTGTWTLNRENSAMTEMTGLTESSEKTLQSNVTGLGLNRENTGMTEMTGLTGFSGSSGKTFQSTAHGGLNLNRENSDMTVMTGFTESSGKTFKTSSSGFGLYRENSGMTELTDLSDHSNAIKVVRPARNTVKGPPKAGRSKPRINSATTSVSLGSSITDVTGYSDSSSASKLTDVETRDGRARGNIDEKKTKSQNIDTKKYTVIMMSITIAFVISFLPYLGLITWRTLVKDYEINLLNKSELVAFQIGIRSFLINSAANPIIYGFLNTEFRHFALSVLCGICGCFRNEVFPKKQSRNSNEMSKESSKCS